MGRAQGHKTRDRNKGSLPQVPKEMKMDRMSEEYAEELNNQLSEKSKLGQCSQSTKSRKLKNTTKFNNQE